MHIRIVIVGRLAWSFSGICGIVLMAVCHGFTSPGIFAGANIIYERSHSRSSILNKGLLSEFPRIRIM